MKIIIIICFIPLFLFAQLPKYGNLASSQWEENTDGSISPKGGKSVSIGNTDPVTISPTTGLLIPTITSSASPINVAKGGYYGCDVVGGCTYNLPAITAANVGMTVCVYNEETRAGAIVLQAPSATTISIYGTAGTAAGTAASTGALGDSACVQAKAVGKYRLVSGGFWSGT